MCGGRAGAAAQPVALFAAAAGAYAVVYEYAVAPPRGGLLHMAQRASSAGAVWGLAWGWLRRAARAMSALIFSSEETACGATQQSDQGTGRGLGLARVAFSSSVSVTCSTCT